MICKMNIFKSDPDPLDKILGPALFKLKPSPKYIFPAQTGTVISNSNRPVRGVGLCPQAGFICTTMIKKTWRPKT